MGAVVAIEDQVLPEHLQVQREHRRQRPVTSALRGRRLVVELPRHGASEAGQAAQKTVTGSTWNGATWTAGQAAQKIGTSDSSAHLTWTAGQAAQKKTNQPD